MKWSQLKEPAAAIGVILSLVFVGLEIRQNTRVARGEARNALAELNQEWVMLQAQDSTFSALWTKRWVEPDSLSESERTRAGWMMIMHLRRLENVYFQYTEGLVDESALNSYGLQATELYTSDEFEAFWSEYRVGFAPEFVAFLDERAGR